MTLGQRIQALRKEHDLSQEGLGEKLGVSRQAISRWEMDGAVPEVDKLIAMSKLFQIPLGQLLGVEEPEPPRPPSSDIWTEVPPSVAALLPCAALSR